jgi:hypothetical protein
MAGAGAEPLAFLIMLFSGLVVGKSRYDPVRAHHGVMKIVSSNVPSCAG